MKTKTFSVVLISFIVIICFTSINIQFVNATGITRVQGNYKGNSVNVNVTVTLGSIPTSGNVLVATVGIANSGTVPYVLYIRDGNGRINWTYQIGKTYADNNILVEVEIWFGIINSSASKTQNITLSGASAQGAVVNICEYSGINTTSFLDKTATAYNTSNTTSTGTTATTTNTSELWVGATTLYTGAGNQSSPTNSFTLLDGVNSVHCSNAYLEKIVSSTGTANSGTTDSGGVDNWVGCIATFKASSGTTTTLNGTITETFTLTSAKTSSFTTHGLSSLVTQILSSKTINFSTYGLSSLATQILSGKIVSFTTHGLILETFMIDGYTSKAIFLVGKILFDLSSYLSKTASFSEYGQNTINFVSIFGRSENLNLYNIILTGFGISSSKAITFNPSGLILETFTTVGSTLVTRFVFLFGKVLFDTAVSFTNYYWLLVSFAFDYSMLIVLLFLLASNIVLCIKRVPMLSWIIGIFSFTIGIYEVNNTSIPANPLFCVMLCTVGAISMFINSLDMRK